MKGALDVHRELLGRDIAHEIVRLPSPVLRAEQLPAALGVDPGQCVAVRLYVAGDRFIALAVPAGESFPPAVIRAVTSAGSVRRATVAETNAITDFPAELVCPLLLPDSVTLLADARLGAGPVLYAPTGETGTALAMRTGDLLLASGARVLSPSESEWLSPGVTPVAQQTGRRVATSRSARPATGRLAAHR